VKDLAGEMAKRFFEAKKRLELARITYSSSSLKPQKWQDCNERERLEIIAAFRELLADKEIMQTLVNRASGL